MGSAEADRPSDGGVAGRSQCLHGHVEERHYRRIKHRIGHFQSARAGAPIWRWKSLAGKRFGIARPDVYGGKTWALAQATAADRNIDIFQRNRMAASERAFAWYFA